MSFSRCPKYFLHRTLATEPVAPRPLLTTAIILNRSPLITRTPTAFERAYYKYQARIQRALHNPFPYDFYFKQGSPLETRFNLEERRRERRAFGKPYGLESDAGGEKPTIGAQEGEGEVIMPRRHEADIKNDVKSLDRKGQRNLYLLLKSTDGEKTVWRFPQGAVERGDLLQQVQINVDCRGSSPSLTGFSGCTKESSRRMWALYGHLDRQSEPDRCI